VFAQRAQNDRAHLPRLCFGTHGRHEDGKLVSRKAAENRRMANAARRRKDGPKAVGNHDEQLITGRMTQRVIHAFEVIEIDKEQRIQPFSRCHRQQCFGLVTEVHPVGKRRNRIKQRHGVDLFHIRANLQEQIAQRLGKVGHGAFNMLRDRGVEIASGSFAQP